MALDRVAAIDYARRFWNRPCDDGVFWLTDQVVNVEQKRRELRAPVSEGWEAFFVSNGSGAEKAVFKRTVSGVVEIKLIQPWEGLADCAHFLSKCLQAGGKSINERGVPELVRKLRERTDTKTLAEKVPQDRGQRIVNSGIFKNGDMIGYFNIDPAGDFDGVRNYSHSTMYAGKLNDTDPGRVTCHTISRFPGLSFVADEWFLHSGYNYTFIHFSDDDPLPTPAMAVSLSGWWKVEYGARTEYYYIFRDGRARYTLRAPASNRELHVAEGSAYWFQALDKVTFIWQKTGTVEVWSPGRGPREFNIKVNDTPGRSTKLF